MQLEIFNQLDPDRAAGILQACAHVPNWIAELLQERP